MAFGEFDLIAKYFTRPVRRAGLGIGDDCAVYRVAPGRVQVVTTDALVEGVHFDRAYAPLGMIGWKAIATAVSDVLAASYVPEIVSQVPSCTSPWSASASRVAIGIVLTTPRVTSSSTYIVSG